MTVGWPLTPLAPIQPVYTKHTLEAMQQFVNKFSRSEISLIRSMHSDINMTYNTKTCLRLPLCRSPNKHFVCRFSLQIFEILRDFSQPKHMMKVKIKTDAFILHKQRRREVICSSKRRIKPPTFLTPFFG